MRTSNQVPHSTKKWVSIMKVTLSAVLVIILVLLSVYDFQRGLFANLEENVYRTLNDQAESNKVIFRAKLDAKLDILESLSAYVKEMKAEEFLNFVAELNSSKETQGDFYNLVRYSVNDGFYGHDFVPTELQKSFLTKAMDGQGIISTPYFLVGSNEKAITFAVPITDMQQNKGVLLGVCNINDFEDALLSSGFQGRSYVFIANSKGEIIADAANGYTLHNNSNILEFYKQVNFLSDADPASIQADLQSESSGTIYYEYMGFKRFAAYVPLGMNEWYIFSVADEWAVMGQSREITTMVWALTIKIVVILLFLSGYAVWDNNRKIKQIKLIHDEVAKAKFAMDSIFENMPSGMFICTTDKNHSFEFVSQGFLDILGYNLAEFAERFENKAEQIVDIEDRERVAKEIHTQSGEAGDIVVQYRINNGDRIPIWVHNVLKEITDYYGNTLFYSVIVDITKYKLLEMELKASEERFRIVSQQSHGVIFEYYVDTDTISFSDNFRSMFILDQEIQSFSGFVQDRDFVFDADKEKVLETLRCVVPHRKEEIRLKKVNGEYSWCTFSASVLTDKYGDPSVVIGKIVDIDKQKVETENLIIQAKTDRLTGLYNKIEAQNQIKGFLSGEGALSSHALMVIDIDDFKSINDKKGHLIGDNVLVEVGTKLRKIFRHTDIVGRIGGDEFVVLYKYHNEIKDTIKKAQEICTMFESTYIVENDNRKISGSVGIAFSSKDAIISYEELFVQADIALYRAKHNGKNRYEIFTANH